MSQHALVAKLERAVTLQDRRAVARVVAKRATPAVLAGIARLLGHPVESVRLGAIEILAEARFRPALHSLAAVTVQRTGDERVHAARTVAALASPGDGALLEPLARTWIADGDAFLALHGRTILEILGVPEDGSESTPGAGADASGGGAAPGSMTPGVGITARDPERREQAIALALEQAADPAALFLEALGDPLSPAVRMDLLAALERLGPRRFAVAATALLGQRGLSAAGDIAALLARSLSRVIGQLERADAAPVVAALDQAHRDLPGESLARAAIDDCLMARISAAADVLCDRADRLSAQAAARLDRELMTLEHDRRVELLSPLLAALERTPRRALLFADVLHDAWPDLGPARSERVRALLLAAAARPLPTGLPARILATIGQLYRAIVEPGDEPPGHVLAALDGRDEPEVAMTAVALYSRVSTEDAAHKLAAYASRGADRTSSGPGSAEVAAAARAALRVLDVRHVAIEVSDDGAVSVTPEYRTPDGEPLTAGPGVLETASGARYVLDENGEPREASGTPWGGCRCCERPRELARRDRRRPRCPVTGKSHLIEDGAATLEQEHPLGGCSECESVRPLVRHGPDVRCDECQTEYVERDGQYVRRRRRRRKEPAGPWNDAPSGPPGPGNPGELPRPPSVNDLQLVEPTIRQAMAANVFIQGDTGDGDWLGSGVIVARDGEQVAILTNRHVVEDQPEDGPATLARIRAYTIAGERVAARVTWRASMGLDLALITATLKQADRVAISTLQEGACLVGSRLFAIGNPMGLSWSYSSGTLAGFRDWKTDRGLEVRFIQSHVNMSSGSSGGGLYHEHGHLVGINSFSYGTIIGPGADQNFSIAMPSVLDALRRERPTFAGKPLWPPA